MESNQYQEITIDEKNKVKLYNKIKQNKKLPQTILITDGKQRTGLITKVISINHKQPVIKYVEKALKITEKLQGKYVPKIVRCFQITGKLYLVMQKAQKNLGSLIPKKDKNGSIQKSSKYLLQSKILNYTKQIVEALDQIKMLYQNQSVDYIHSNINPSNLLLFEKENEQRILISGHLKLKIKQAIKKASGRQEKSKKFTGIFRFFAPELIDKKNIKQITSKADVWSIGIIILYMMGQELYHKQLSELEMGTIITILPAYKLIHQRLEKLWENEGSLIIKKSKVNKLFWRQLLAGMLEFQPEKRWEIKRVRNYINQHYEKQMHQAQMKQVLQIKNMIYNDKTIQKCWYDIHKFEYWLIYHIFTIYDIIDCDQRQIVHLSILLLLSILQYKKSFQIGIKQKKYKDNYGKRLFLEHANILESNNRKHFQEAKERVQYLLQAPKSQIIIQHFNQFKDLNKLCEYQKNPLNYNHLMHEYISIFEAQIKICQLSQCYLILFKVVAAKKHLILSPNKLDPLIDKYEQIFKEILMIKSFLLKEQQKVWKIKSKKSEDFQTIKERIKDFQQKLNNLYEQQVQNQLFGQSEYQMNLNDESQFR